MRERDQREDEEQILQRPARRRRTARRSARRRRPRRAPRSRTKRASPSRRGNATSAPPSGGGRGERDAGGHQARLLNRRRARTGRAAAQPERRGRRDDPTSSCHSGLISAPIVWARPSSTPPASVPHNDAEPADDHRLEGEDQPRRADRRIEIGADAEKRPRRPPTTASARPIAIAKTSLVVDRPSTARSPDRRRRRGRPGPSPCGRRSDSARR